MVIARIGNGGSRHRDVAAEQADDDVLAALDQAVDAELHGRRRADQIDHRPGAAVGRA